MSYVCTFGIYIFFSKFLARNWTEKNTLDNYGPTGQYKKGLYKYKYFSTKTDVPHPTPTTLSHPTLNLPYQSMVLIAIMKLWPWKSRSRLKKGLYKYR